MLHMIHSIRSTAKSYQDKTCHAIVHVPRQNVNGIVNPHHPARRSRVQALFITGVTSDERDAYFSSANGVV